METDEDEGFLVEEYSKVAAILWRIQVDHGNGYMLRLVHSVLRTLTEGDPQKQ
jgi:hypothetical protein